MYESLLVDFSIYLNNFHGKNYSSRYWRILIGPWLGVFIQVLYDRWTTLGVAVETCEINECIVLDISRDMLVPKSNSQFVHMIVEDEWNSGFYGELITRCFSKKIPIKRKVNLFRFNATFQAISTFKKALYPDYTDLVYWPVGKSMEVHADSKYLDGSDGKFPWRKISGVLYLNDDYEGGETYFPEQNVKYIPEAGHLIMFPSDLTHPHGVTEITKGDRYTLPIWFTDDETKLEI